MLGKRSAGWVLRLLVADAVALVTAFFVAYALRVVLDRPLGRAAAPLGHYLWLLGPILSVWIGLLAAMGAYGMLWTARSRSWLIVRVSAVGFLLLTAGLFLVKESEINRSILALFVGVGAVGLWTARALVQSRLLRAGQGHRWSRVALVVGTEERVSRVVAALREYPEAGWGIGGWVTLDPPGPELAAHDPPVIGVLADLLDLLQGERVVDEVFFAVPAARLDELADALEVCESLGVDTRVLVDLHRPARARPFVEEILGLPFYGFSPTLTRQGALAAKRLIDAAGASILLLALSPVFVAVGLLVKLTSPGAVVFRQERSGFHGRRFWMHKFRTMVEGAERMRDQVTHLNEIGGPVFKVREDPRITGVGRYLRRTSLDELPQLWNVLKGEMSLVGPRPLPVYEADQIKGAQRRRLAMRPGMTGLWQVGGRSTVDFDEWMRMDLLYVDHWSLALDLEILLRTIPRIVRGEGAS
jgi:exopolysaccharide biosynthesis polyprenyl glycosylphosphotransferase